MVKKMEKNYIFTNIIEQFSYWKREIYMRLNVYIIVVGLIKMLRVQCVYMV
jgi:hypothetical protein